jgi:hypothetical protein
VNVSKPYSNLYPKIYAVAHFHSFTFEASMTQRQVDPLEIDLSTSTRGRQIGLRTSPKFYLGSHPDKDHEFVLNFLWTSWEWSDNDVQWWSQCHAPSYPPCDT